MAPRLGLFVVLLLLFTAGACSSGPPAPSPPDAAPPSDARAEHADDAGALEPSEKEPDEKETGPREDPPAPEVVVPYALVRRTQDPATAGFARVVEKTLEDPRGWQRAGFDLRRKDGARYRVILAEGPEVDRLCLPYETHATYSCQNGPVVALNADRWRTATPQWTGSLPAYRRMLVNHEVGHLLGQHHPEVQCPGVGKVAPVMAQQSTELNGCLPNPWPLPREIRRAARHDLPLAPPFEG